MLFIHLSKYMYLNPLTAGRASGEDRTKGHAIRLAAEWKIPFDPRDDKRNQLFFLSDSARPDNREPWPSLLMKNVVMETYEQFFETSRAQDRIAFYFGGHALEVAGKTYLAPIEGDPDDVETLIPLADVYAKLKACKATQKVVIWDVCRYNPQRGHLRRGSSPMTESLYNSLSAAPEGVEVVIACKPDENALEFFHIQAEPGQSESSHKYGGSVILESMRFAAANTKELNPLPTAADPIPVAAWIPPVAKRVDAIASAPVVNLKQTVNLHGKMNANQTPPDADEAPAKRFAYPTTPKQEALAVVTNAVMEFRVPPLRLDFTETDLTLLPFREEVMNGYEAGVTAQEALAQREKYKFESRTLGALEKVRRIWTVFPGPAGGPQLRDSIQGPVNDALKTALKKDQDFWAISCAELELLNEDLEMLAPARKDQTKRWQAHYDYARATVKARLAFINEYNKMMGNVLTETLPPLNTKLGQDTFKLAAAEKMKSGKDVQRLVEESRKLFDKIITEHKGTPWAVQAKRDKNLALGLMWVPTNSEAGGVR